VHAPCSPFPLLRSRSSPACVERPVKSHPETFCVGVSDSGVAGRIRGSGRMNNVYNLLSRPVRSFTIEPSGFHKSQPLSPRALVLVQSLLPNSQSSRHSDFAANNLHSSPYVRPRSAKRLFACVMSVHFYVSSSWLLSRDGVGYVLDRVFLA
jgi:hypothetical protein